MISLELNPEMENLLGITYPLAVTNPFTFVAVHVYVPYDVTSAVRVNEGWLFRTIPFGIGPKFPASWNKMLNVENERSIVQLIVNNRRALSRNNL